MVDVRDLLVIASAFWEGVDDKTAVLGVDCRTWFLILDTLSFEDYFIHLWELNEMPAASDRPYKAEKVYLDTPFQQWWLGYGPQANVVCVMFRGESG